jgi:hypothetical protein
MKIQARSVFRQTWGLSMVSQSFRYWESFMGRRCQAQKGQAAPLPSPAWTLPDPHSKQ